MVAVLLVPIQITVFAIYPYLDTPWRAGSACSRTTPSPGSSTPDLLLVVDNILLVAIALATYVALSRINASVTTIALGLWLVSLGLLIASNPGDRDAVAGRSVRGRHDRGRTRGNLAAGEAMPLATWEGTAFQVSYIVGQLSKPCN